MESTLTNILGPDGAIARRLGERYEHRPQQLEMAAAVGAAFKEGHHLLVEAGTGVGKSFAYLLPAIEFAVKHKKRVVISTHTISLQEQLIDKDIPLLRSVYPDEFTAVLVKGRNNYLCRRRLEQARGRQNYLFEQQRQLDSLWMIEEWAGSTTEGSLADLPSVPEPEVWGNVCAEHGNCLGKKCVHYNDCFWQAAKRRMQVGNILVVNHALLFSDLALRMAGVNYLPKYDLLILDEAHTVEDVAGEHFGLKITEGGIKYELRALYDLKRGKGILSTHGSVANDAIRDVVDLHEQVDEFFARCLHWQQERGRGNGRIQQANWVDNDLSPKLRDLAKHIKAMLTQVSQDEEISELTSHASKVAGMAEALETVLGQKMEDAVYWMESSMRAPRRVSLHAAPVDVAQGLKKYLFERLHSVVMTSATLCAGSGEQSKPMHGLQTRATGRAISGTGFQPVRASRKHDELQIRKGAYPPHWTKESGIYAVTFRLADALPAHVLETWRTDRLAIIEVATQQNRQLTEHESRQLEKLHSEKVEAFLDAGQGACWLAREDIATVMSQALEHHNGERYRLLGWVIMPNHAHIVVQPAPGNDLPKVLHSWKRYVAREANKLLGRTGEFWQPEYYDHLVRDDDDLQHALDYAWENPDKAGLEDWKWRRVYPDVINSLVEVSQEHGLKTRATEGAIRGTGFQPVQETPDPRFAYIKARLGVVKERTLALGSPFDYGRQATLYIETDLPDPNDGVRFLPAALGRIDHYVRQTNGGAFILFTSYKMLKEAAARLRPKLEAMGYPVLVHGEGAPRKILLERFRTMENGVLFGTASFWQGIDVQGDALRNVIIVKLPFAVPDEPVIEARLENIQRRGGNAFMEYSVPEAVIKLKQGFGRLIRSKTDCGIVAILDSRVMTKRYGKIFLEALPQCRRVMVGNSGTGF